MTITRKAYAKINLFLDITGRRSDGYHTITGVMQAIDHADTVTVSVTEPVGKCLCVMGPRPGTAESVSLTCTNPDLPTDSRNLAWRAAEAFFSATGFGCRSLRIHIEKAIPAAAGLAGGSTDAAAVLSALNEIFDSPLTPEALAHVGLSLGADVPFCLAGGAHLTEGIGEELTPIAPLPPCTLVVACAGEGVSTPVAYRLLDKLYGNFAPDAYRPERARLHALLTTLNAGELAGVCDHTFNLFESAILSRHAVASAIREDLLIAGALTARMSGSGPSVFGIFPPDSPAAMAAADALKARGIPTWLCRPAEPHQF